MLGMGRNTSDNTRRARWACALLIGFWVTYAVGTVVSRLDWVTRLIDDLGCPEGADEWQDIQYACGHAQGSGLPFFFAVLAIGLGAFLLALRFLPGRCLADTPKR